MKHIHLGTALAVASLVVGAAACGDSSSTSSSSGSSGVIDTDGGSSSGDGGSTTQFTVSGTVTGLTGTGLTLESNGLTAVVPKAGTTFTLSAKVNKGTAYNLVVKTQPTSPAQVCSVANGTGTVTADVKNIAVTCKTDTYAITANINGLTGTGLVLQNNGADDTTVAAAATKATFATKIAAGSPYAVTVKTQPVGQACTVTGGTGTVVAGDVSSVNVNCVKSYTVGGTVTGLAGKGFILQNNAGGDLPINANGSFAFVKTELTGAAYAVTVKTQPGTPTQTCVVTKGSGTVASANITDIEVACTTNKYVVKGTITGLDGDGTVLQNSAGDDLPVAKGATAFTFATSVDSGATYAVTVKTQPSTRTQNCVVTNGAGTVGAADVTNVAIACTTSKFKVGGTVSGLLANTSVVLQNNAGDDLTLNANAAFNFVTLINSGDAYAVTVKTQPVGNVVCSVSAGSGTVGAADVTNVVVSCSADCRTANGVLWCRDPSANACGEPCNAVCAKYGMVPEDNAKVLAAQNTVPLCTAVRDAFSIADPVNVGGYTYACAENGQNTFYCSNDVNCPNSHRTQCDGQGTANCAAGGFKGICGCK